MTDEFTPLEVHRLDGTEVPTFWVPADEVATAGLTFRVGRTAEPMAQLGINRLVEVSVASHLGRKPSPALTTAETTTFSFRGPFDEVDEFLFAVSATLSSLPLELVDSARELVRAEDRDRTFGPWEQLARLRHGFTGFGVGALPDYGIHKSGHRQVLNWATKYYNRSNAALWFTGPTRPEPTLRLLNGAPVRLHHQTQAVPLPGAIVGEAGRVGISLVGPRSLAMTAAMELATARARRELVDVHKLSTAVVLGTQELGQDELEAVVIANCAPGKDDEVAFALTRAFEALAEQGPTEDELRRYRTAVRKRSSDQRFAATVAHGAAVATLSKRPQTLPADTIIAVETLDELAITAALQHCLGTRLIVAAETAHSVHSRFANVEHWTADDVKGAASIAPKKDANGHRPDRELKLGPYGASIRDGRQQTSVRFADIGLLLIHTATGEHELLSEDGTRLRIVPAEWDVNESFFARIENEVPPANRVVFDSRWTESGGPVERRMRTRA